MTYGWCDATFSKGIDDVICLGFLTIECVGGGTGHTPTPYRLSDEWRLYGTPAFCAPLRAKRRTYVFPSGRNHPKHVC